MGNGSARQSFVLDKLVQTENRSRPWRAEHGPAFPDLLAWLSLVLLQTHESLFPGRFVPPTWTYECDEDLVHFLYDHIGKEDENLGSVKQYVDSIDVSSYTVS